MKIKLSELKHIINDELYEATRKTNVLTWESYPELQQIHCFLNGGMSLCERFNFPTPYTRYMGKKSENNADVMSRVTKASHVRALCAKCFAKSKQLRPDEAPTLSIPTSPTPAVTRLITHYQKLLVDDTLGSWTLKRIKTVINHLKKNDISAAIRTANDSCGSAKFKALFTDLFALANKKKK